MFRNVRRVLEIEAYVKEKIHSLKNLTTISTRGLN